MPPPHDPDDPEMSPDCWDCGTFYVDVIGPYPLAGIVTAWSEHTRETNEHVERIIDHSWLEHTQRARRDNRMLYDGPLCRLAEFRAGAAELHLTLGPVSYREFLGTNLTHAHLRYVHGAGVMANPLGVSAALTSRDGFLLLGRRSDRVIYHARRIHPVGGLVEPNARADAAPDPVATMLQELREETNVPAERVLQNECLGLVRDKHIVQPELLFDIRIDADAQSIYRCAAEAPDAQEHSQLVPIRDHPAAVVNFIEQHLPQLTPVALASLLLHGLRHWGGGWFATTRGYLRGVI